MKVPDGVREEIRVDLWKRAEALDWDHLTLTDKSRHYQEWTQAPGIGGVLERYIDKGRVRVYLKDTLLKDYTRQAESDVTRPLRALGIDPSCSIAEVYDKPHGRRLIDGRTICWGRASAWRGIVTALYERTYSVPQATAFGIVFLNASGRWDQPGVRKMIETAAMKLGVPRVVWLAS